MDYSAYQNFWDSLVLENYILVFPTTESSISPVHQNLADDLKFLVTEIRNNGAGTFIPSASIASQSAVMGHSMGGGCSFLAASNNSSITTMVSFAAANTTPSSINASQNISVPTLIFSATNDCVAPPALHQDPMYDSCTAAYKTQIYVSGGGHCYFANNNLFCSLGEAGCSPSPVISRTDEQDAVNDFLKLWLAYYLKGECNKAQEFQDSLTASSRITFRQNLPLSCSSTVNDVSDNGSINIFPNPGVDILTITSSKRFTASVRVYNITMSEIKLPFHYLSDKSLELDISSLPYGSYFVLMGNNSRTVFLK